MDLLCLGHGNISMFGKVSMILSGSEDPVDRFRHVKLYPVQSNRVFLDLLMGDGAAVNPKVLKNVKDAG